MFRNFFTRSSLILLGLLILCTAGYSQSGWPYREALKKEVHFWKQIFTFYSQDQYVLHDAENLSIIYKVVTFDSSVSERAREKQLNSIKDDIKNTLRHLAARQEDDLLSVDDMNILNLFGDSAQSEVLRSAGDNIRAQQGMREKFKEGMEQALAYLPFIEQVFIEEGVPRGLSALPHIESSFNPLARSHAGAAGMWQFMRSTARLFMKVNRIIDQRYDPLISTRAAARLMKYNYQKTGDWGLAVTAYNFGLAGIQRAARLHGSDYLKVRESFKNRRFRFASKNFYPEFLAVTEIMDHAQAYFPDAKPASLPAKLKYRLKKSIQLPQLARRMGLDLDELKALNPVYTSRAWRGWVNIPAGYWLNLPAGTDLAGLDKYFHETSMKLAENEKDETAGKNISESSTIIIVSPAENQDLLGGEVASAGPVLWEKPGVLPEKSPSPIIMENLRKQVQNNNSDSVLSLQAIDGELQKKLSVRNGAIIVFANETLGHYADWLNIPTNRLRVLNGLRMSQNIYQGQKLDLIFDRVSPEEFQKRRFSYHLGKIKPYLKQKQFVHFINYKVNSGESVWELAQYRYRVPVEMIQYLNASEDINNLYPGDVIRIPVLSTNNSMEETL